MLADQQLRAAHRSNETVWALLADVDGLKQINDQLGHDAGDRLLCAAARALRETFREQDIVGRIGGDEFAVFGVSDHAYVDAVARLQTSIDRYNADRGGGPELSMSCGLVESASRRGTSLDALLARRTMPCTG